MSTFFGGIFQRFEQVPGEVVDDPVERDVLGAVVHHRLAACQPVGGRIRGHHGVGAVAARTNRRALIGWQMMKIHLRAVNMVTLLYLYRSGRAAT